MQYFYKKKYTEVFYMSYEADGLSFQYMTSLDRCTSVREIDGLSIFFINVYLPVPTSRLPRYTFLKT